MEARERLINWANSLNQLDSAKLSAIGIDDIGDLLDEVPAFRQWIDEFWSIVGELDDGS